MNKPTKIIIAILCYLFVAKTDWTKRPDGSYVTSGIRKYNPIAWVLAILVSTIVGVEAFGRYFWAAMKDIINT